MRIWFLTLLPRGLGLAFVLGLAGVPLSAAESTSQRYRYLFLIDTSQAMAPHQAGIAHFVGATIRSEFEERIRPGESIGIWLFNDKLVKDARPVEFWALHQRERIAAETEKFMTEQAFGKAVRFRLVTDALETLVKEADQLTLFIISSSQQRMRGTPFDDRVNDAYSKAPRPRSGPVPAVVTRFVAQRGMLTGWSVHALTGLTNRTLPDFNAVAAMDAPLRASPAVLSTPEPEPSVEAPPAVEPATPPPAPIVIVERALPPAPILSPELTKPLRIAPLRHDEEGRGSPLVIAMGSGQVQTPSARGDTSPVERVSPKSADVAAVKLETLPSAPATVMEKILHASPATVPSHPETTPAMPESSKLVESGPPLVKVEAAPSSAHAVPPDPVPPTLPEQVQPASLAARALDAVTEPVPPAPETTPEKLSFAASADRSSQAPPLKELPASKPVGIEAAPVTAAVPLPPTAGRNALLIWGVGLLGIAALLTAFTLRKRGTKRQPSLISRSMQPEE